MEKCGHTGQYVLIGCNNYTPSLSWTQKEVSMTGSSEPSTSDALVRNVKYIKASDKGQNIISVEKSRLDIVSKGLTKSRSGLIQACLQELFHSYLLKMETTVLTWMCQAWWWCNCIKMGEPRGDIKACDTYDLNSSKSLAGIQGHSFSLFQWPPCIWLLSWEPNILSERPKETVYLSRFWATWW